MSWACRTAVIHSTRGSSRHSARSRCSHLSLVRHNRTGRRERSRPALCFPPMRPPCRRRLRSFLDEGEPPIVFTLGSSAVGAAGSFYDESVSAAEAIGRRAILLVGLDPRNRPQRAAATIGADRRLRAALGAVSARGRGRSSRRRRHDSRGTSCRSADAGRAACARPAGQRVSRRKARRGTSTRRPTVSGRSGGRSAADAPRWTRRIRQTRSESPNGSRERMAQRQPLIRLRRMAVRTATFRDHARRLSADWPPVRCAQLGAGHERQLQRRALEEAAPAHHHGQRGPQGHADAGQFLEVDGTGAVRGARGRQAVCRNPSPLDIVRARDAGAVLHTHSVWGTILSDLHADSEGLAIEGFEMLKGLDGVTTHEHREWVPIVANDQDMVRLAGRVSDVLDRDTRRARSTRFFFAVTGSTPGAARSPTPNVTSRFSSFCSRQWAEGVSHGGNQNSRSGSDDRRCRRNPDVPGRRGASTTGRPPRTCPLRPTRLPTRCFSRTESRSTS